MLLQHWSALALVCLDIGPLVCLALSALALVCFGTEFDSNQQITWSVYTNAILPIPLFHMQGSSTVQNRRITQRSIPLVWCDIVFYPCKGIAWSGYTNAILPILLFLMQQSSMAAIEGLLRFTL